MNALEKALVTEEPLAPGEALEACQVLVPMLDLLPADERLADAVERVIGRTAPEPLITPVLDWWFEVTTGRGSPTGAAYMLPEEIPIHVRDSMTALLGIESSVPKAQWLAARRRLQSALADLDMHLDLEFYGASRLPGEREVWGNLLESMGDAIGALREGTRSSDVEFDRHRYERDMKAAGIDQGSRRWREMIHRAEQAVEFIEQTLESQRIVGPWKQQPAVATIDVVPAQLLEPFGSLGKIVYGPLLSDEARRAPQPTPVGQSLDTAAHELSEKGKAILFSVSRNWLQAHEFGSKTLAPFMQKAQNIEDRVHRLNARGVDTELVELALEESDLGGAESILQDLEGEYTRRQRTEAAALQLRRLQELTSRVDEHPEAGWGEQLAAIASAIEREDLDEANRLITATDRELKAFQRSALLAEAVGLRNAIAALSPPESVVFDVDEQLNRLRDDPGARAPVDYLEGLRTLEINLRDERRRATEWAIHESRALLDDLADQVTADELADLGLKVTAAEDDLRADQVPEALTEAREALGSIRARRMHRWEFEQGENALVEHLVEYCTTDVQLDPNDIRRLHVAVKTKPFVILAGLTGSGKSTSARLYAEAMGANSENGQFRRIAVRPDWIDQSEVLGYINPTTNRFEPGWLADVARQCERNRDRLFFVLLDEMNLAPVEHYMAEVLSAMEESRSSRGSTTLPLYQPSAEPTNAAEWPAELSYPTNLVIFGTVNVDETTRPLSDRVIDRANVLQLSLTMSRGHHDVMRELKRPWFVPFNEWRRIIVDEPSDRHHDLLVQIAEILREAGIGVGMRAHVELERFLANAAGIVDDATALDWGVLQRVIPKIRAFKRDVADALEELAALLTQHGADRSASVLRRWSAADVPPEEFLDGTDGRVALLT